MSQPTDHPDSFSILAVSDSMGDMDSQEPKRITVWESMTVEDFDDTCKHAFSSQPIWKIEVLWKEGNRDPTEIKAENCSQVLRILKGRRGDQLAIYCYDDDDMSTGSEASGEHARVS